MEEFGRLEASGQESVRKMIEKCAEKGEIMYQEELLGQMNDEYDECGNDSNQEDDTGMEKGMLSDDEIGEMVPV
jgi:hypothetical protein